MGEDIKLNQSYWKSFRLPDGKRRWFYTDDESVLRIVDKEWFNKATMGINIHKGFETEEYSIEPISEMIYRITVDYQILNYFCDRSGMHYRSKVYMLVGNKLYKQEKGDSVEVKRITKELKGTLAELNKQRCC